MDADTLAWLDAMATDINENVEERINLQKALFELEDINVCNKYELASINEMLDAGAGSACGWVVCACARKSGWRRREGGHWTGL